MNNNEIILKISDFISLENIGDKCDFRADNGNSFWIKEPVEYNKYISSLYIDLQSKKEKISINKFEQLVITDYFDLIINNENIHDLKKEIKRIPVNQIHVLLPVFNIQITTDKIKIGEYYLVQFQKIGEYIRGFIKDIDYIFPEVGKDDFENDSYFYYVPFVDIIVDARDNIFAVEVAKTKLQSFISFLNYCLFSDIKGVDVVSDHTDAGNKNRYYVVSPTSVSLSYSANHPRVKRPDISELLEHITVGESNHRLIGIVQKDCQENELEKRIFNALNWLGLAIAEKNDAIALTQATFAIECLLQSDVKGEPITKSIVASISESLAFLLGNNYDKRKEWEKNFKTLYGLRSKVAHGKGNDVSIDNVLACIDVAKQAIIAILTIPELKNAKTIQMVNNYIEKKRYTCMEDGQ